MGREGLDVPPTVSGPYYVGGEGFPQDSQGRVRGWGEEGLGVEKVSPSGPPEGPPGHRATGLPR